MHVRLEILKLDTDCVVENIGFRITIPGVRPRIIWFYLHSQIDGSAPETIHALSGIEPRRLTGRNADLGAFQVFAGYVRERTIPLASLDE
jgi:hypothetical protein